ncbi:Glycosyltransferase involved in cell wall bisynthesis [Pseudarcicella hirudinis]|uniref:Glycosyltransferase involved in cell wall bisynthesis n=1 Tax=Pseudarcicella hirudinis TaxID=1079859 RepID=A0A1I5YP66_9BACT|nr:DUF1972 domain-containing protein [Pseudarcicella hirudinis]SFQ46061.1 Glycosyltransferase involved in cell wall bisynthesis [Pseudarcicella hirudinis]
MKIGIIGTRGIPNNYGGFEQFAEYLAEGLVKRGIEVTVYNSHNHPFQEQVWRGVDIVHCYDPEDKYGTIGQFIYDLNCIIDSRKRNFDIILQLGYTSSTVWGWLLPFRKSIVTTNMDGLEWVRTKYSKPVRKFLKFAEYLATKFSNHWISDSIGIQEYLEKEYKLQSVYIPYGAFAFENPDVSALEKYQLSPFQYNMLIARLEPENNIETILDGVVESKIDKPFLVVGKHETSFGRYLKDKFKDYPHIQFIGGIFDINVLNNLRYYSNLYFHGHSAGGTNPSLLEAMASGALICAHQNTFNGAILEKDAFYFKESGEVSAALQNVQKSEHLTKTEANVEKIRKIYSWEIIIEQYLNHFLEIYKKDKVLHNA